MSILSWLGLTNPHRVTPTEAKRRVDEGALLLDVRTPGEHAQAHIPGSKNVPLGQIPSRMGEIPKGPVVVYCQSGMRSRRAATLLKKAGFEDVGDLGAMSAWPREEA